MWINIKCTILFKIHSRFPIIIDIFTQSYLANYIVSVKSKVNLFVGSIFTFWYQHRIFRLKLDILYFLITTQQCFRKQIGYAIMRTSLENTLVVTPFEIKQIFHWSAQVAPCWFSVSHWHEPSRSEWGYALFSFLTKSHPLLNAVLYFIAW